MIVIIVIFVTIVINLIIVVIFVTIVINLIIVVINIYLGFYSSTFAYNRFSSKIQFL